MATNEVNSRARSNWPWNSLWIMLLVFVLFALAYSQAPLYTSNQNQYFLHGAAAADVGSLELDWLANTIDPTPVFSALVQLTFLLDLPILFHLYYFVLLAVYLYSIWGLLHETLRPDWNSMQRWVALVALIAMHSFAFRFGLSRLLGQDWRFILEGGFAGQRLLGTVFQPSNFGVLLLLGALLFIRGKRIPAVLSVILAATVHPTYLLSAALLIAGFMLVSLINERSLREPAMIGLLALLLISPILWYTWTHFQPTSPELTGIASQILVEERIPNHVLPEEWLNLTVLFHTAIVLIAVVTYRRRPIAVMMGLIAAGIFVLTLFQIESGNQRLALLFPWRPSALLVPLASTLLLGYFADRLFQRSNLFNRRHRQSLLAVTWAGLFLLAALGAGSYLYDLRRKRLDTARPMFEYIQANQVYGDRFLTPPKQQDFRLATGAPILVDFKSIPYVDSEVIEWHNRLKTAQNFYRDTIRQSQCNQIDRAISIGVVNHVVLGPDQLGLVCPQFSKLLFADDSYQVYRLHGQE